MNPLRFAGPVERGEGMASRLGCPTANVSVREGALIPGAGVYVGEAELDGVRHPSVICVSDGRSGDYLKLEVHLLGQDMELRGKYLSVVLLEKMRSLVPFESEEKMRDIIAKDLENAKEWFLKNHLVM